MIAVYTAIFGDYDTLKAPLFIDTLVDYIVFTDAPHLVTPFPWQVRTVTAPHSNPGKASRFYFDQSCRALPEYKYTVMHGANALLNCEASYLLSFLRGNDIAAFRHPHRNNVYDEQKVIIQMGKDRAENTTAQMQRYRSEGFPGTTLTACTLLVRRNTPALRQFEDLWWEEVRNGSYRDQLSFDYCRWRLDMGVSYLPGTLFSTDYFKVGSHK